MILDDFSNAPESRWSYVADQVMGGVSDGEAQLGHDGEDAFIRLTGTVSTDNNGGFIQVRRQLEDGLPPETQSLNLTVRGNGETYYVFLRSRKGTRPWHSYRASFAAREDWAIVSLPIDQFEPSRPELPAKIMPGEVTGIGLVAYGADFEADLSVKSIAIK